jgi:mono/diheme cytochrome c family protein
MKKTIYSLCSVLLLSLMAAAANPAKPPQSERTPDGEEAYRTNCTRCHNTPPSLTERQTRVVVSHMRVRANLTESDAKAILHYLAENARSK